MFKRQKERELYKTTMSKRLWKMAYCDMKGYLNYPTNIEEPWHVKSQDTITRWYVVLKPYTMYACCSCKWAIWSNLCKHQIVIIFVHNQYFGIHSFGVLWDIFWFTKGKFGCFIYNTLYRWFDIGLWWWWWLWWWQGWWSTTRCWCGWMFPIFLWKHTKWGWPFDCWSSDG